MQLQDNKALEGFSHNLQQGLPRAEQLYSLSETVSSQLADGPTRRRQLADV